MHDEVEHTISRKIIRVLDGHLEQIAFDSLLRTYKKYSLMSLLFLEQTLS